MFLCFSVNPKTAGPLRAATVDFSLTLVSAGRPVYRSATTSFFVSGCPVVRMAESCFIDP